MWCFGKEEIPPPVAYTPPNYPLYIYFIQINHLISSFFLEREREHKSYDLSTILIHVAIDHDPSRALIHPIFITLFIHPTIPSTPIILLSPSPHSIQTNDSTTTHKECTILPRHLFPSVTPYSNFTIIPPPSERPSPTPTGSIPTQNTIPSLTCFPAPLFSAYPPPSRLYFATGCLMGCGSV